jgi:hypothetical protein
MEFFVVITQRVGAAIMKKPSNALLTPSEGGGQLTAYFRYTFFSVENKCFLAVVRCPAAGNARVVII